MSKPEPVRPSEADLFEHQRRHPATQMAKLHSDGVKIAPTWTKVTSTPWEARAKLNGGYGKKMKRTMISSDSPTDFVNPEKVPPPIVPRLSVDEASVTKISKKRDPYGISFVLPGGLRSDAERAKPQKFRSFPFGKQMILEPMASTTKLNRSILKWDDSPSQSVAPSHNPSNVNSARSLNSARNSLANASMSSSRQLSARSVNSCASTHSNADSVLGHSARMSNVLF